jgi:hypothetical protein
MENYTYPELYLGVQHVDMKFYPEFILMFQNIEIGLMQEKHVVATMYLH